jgi:hypothetical protein
MSAHYTINISIVFSESIPSIDREMMSYLFGDSAEIPSKIPDHRCFDSQYKNNTIPIKKQYGEAGRVEGFSLSFVEKGNINSYSGINAVLSGLHDLWETLLLTEWLCQFAKDDGIIGYSCMEDSGFSTCIFYAHKGKLFFYEKKNADGLVCFSTGESLDAP